MRTRSAGGTADVEDTIRLVSESDHERSLGATDPSFGGSGPPTGGQDEFLALLAHEVRNPLAPIANAVAVLNGISSNEPVRWLWIVPINERERRLARERSSASLVTQLASQRRSWVYSP